MMYGFCLFLIINQIICHSVRGFFVGFTVGGWLVTPVVGGVGEGLSSVVVGVVIVVMGVSSVVVEDSVNVVAGDSVVVMVTSSVEVMGSVVGSIVVGGAVVEAAIERTDNQYYS